MSTHDLSTRRHVLRFAVFIAIAVSTFSRGAADDDGDGEARPANESAIIKRVFTNWKARDERFKSLHVVWDEHLLLVKNRVGLRENRPREEKSRPALLLHYDYWSDGKGRSRIEKWYDGFPQPKNVLLSEPPRESKRGQISESLVWQDKSTRRPQVTHLLARAKDIKFDRALVFELTRRHFVDDGQGPRPEQVRVLSENAVLENCHCVKIRISDASGTSAEYFWVDPARDDLVLLWQRSMRGVPAMSISLQYRRDPAQGWILAGWTRRVPNEISDATVTQLAINSNAFEDKFPTSFPIGTEVVDFNSKEQYTFGKEGSKVGVRRLRGFSDLDPLETLEQPVDFAIDSEPLKDALDFIHNRYMIPVHIDEKAFREVSLDPKAIEVESSAQIECWEVLDKILSQCPKPVEFTLSAEAIIIRPVAGAKPVGDRAQAK